MTVTEPEPLNTRIRRLRLEAGLSQEQLAERSGLSARAISDIERGQRSHTRPETLRMLADSLSLSDEERRTLMQASRPDLRKVARVPNEERLLPGRLPDFVTELIGRNEELAELMTLLANENVNLITLIGPGGVGKTRLAIECARQVSADNPDGVVFIDLSSVSDHNLVAHAIAEALGVRDSGDKTIRQSLGLALHERRLLLVLDNFEQVIDAAGLISELLSSAPHLRFLITSREALRVRREAEFAVQPLDLPEERDNSTPELVSTSASVQLFLSSAQTVRPGLSVTTENAEAIAGICNRLDGLPLAIELAAARLRHFPPSTLLEHLDRRLPVLTGGRRDAPTRQQTLSDTIRWSYDLLTTDEQALFRRTSVFAGGASLQAIESVSRSFGDLELDLLAGMASLVDKNLVREVLLDDGDARFSMLETIREFASEQLRLAGETDLLLEKLADWGVAFLETQRGLDSFIAELPTIQLIENEIDNIRVVAEFAQSRGDAELCAQLSGGLFNYFYLRGRYREAVELVRSGLDQGASHPASDFQRSVLLGYLAVYTSMLGDAKEAEAQSREGLALLNSSEPDSVMNIELQIALAITLREQGRYEEALVHAEQSLRQAEAAGYPSLVALALFHVGKLHFLQLDLDRALICLTDALDQSIDNRTETALYAANYVTAIHCIRGSLREAAKSFRVFDSVRASAGGLEVGFLYLFVVGALAAAASRPVDAARFLGVERAIERLHGVGSNDEPWIAELKATLKAELGDVAYEAAIQEGYRLELDRAMEMMYDLLDDIEHRHP